MDIVAQVPSSGHTASHTIETACYSRAFGEVTLANAAINGVALAARVADALHDPLPRSETAVANVLLAPVEAILARLDAERAVTSGYLR